MKRKALLLAILFLLSIGLYACGGGEEQGETPAPVEGTEGEETTTDEETKTTKSKLDPETLVVGTPEMNGDFISGFTNSSYDVAVKSLLGNYGHYYATYGINEGGEFILDQTVNTKEPEITENSDGTKTYRFFINPDLVWNDGTPITAKDYVLGALFEASPQWAEAGAGQSTGDTLVGYEAYHNGESNSLPGIKYIDDQTFEVTIAKEFLPYYYEKALVATSPTPMHRYVPNMDIGEDGSSLIVKDGYTVDDAAKKEYAERLENEKAAAQRKFDNDMAQIEDDKKNYPDDYSDEDYEADKVKAQEALDASIAKVDKTLAELESGTFDQRDVVLLSSALDIAQTYRYKPDVTCGPYQFVSFENQNATLTINDKFLGDYMGRKPKIKNIVQKYINEKQDVDTVIAGELDIVSGVIDGAKIEKAKENSDSVNVQAYPRNGYGNLKFLTDLGATKYKEVRQAIAYLMDRNVFVQNVLGGYGSVVNSEYGLAQWMYQERGEELEEKMNHYTVNPDKANELLDKTPYIYEKDGKTAWSKEKAKEAFDADSENFDYYRYDANGNELVVNHFGAAENVLETIKAEIPKNGKLVGLRYNAELGSFNTLLEYLYNPDEDNPKYTAFSMANYFGIPHDPYYNIHSSQIGNNNTTRTNDPECDRLVEALRYTDPDDREGYLDTWVEYMIWWNDYLPEVPLYSNMYHDVYSKRIGILNTSSLWDWYREVINLEIQQ